MGSLLVKDKQTGPLTNLSLARYKDIVLMGQTAFHARTMEIAELSKEMAYLLSPISLKQDAAPQHLRVPEGDRRETDSLQKEILQELEAWNQAEMQAKVANSSDIRAITINATQICNLHCTYCAAGGDGTYANPQKQIDLLKAIPELKRVLEGKLEASALHITFLGGEPLLFPKGIRVLCEFLTEFAKTKNIELTFKVTTNGTIMNETILSVLNDYSIGVAVSCDGIPEIQDHYRPSKSRISSSAMIEKSVRELLLQRKNIPFVGVHCVVHTSEQNLLRSVDYFKTLGFDWYEFTPDVSNSSEELTESYLNSMSELAQREYVLGGIKALCRIQNFERVFARLEQQAPLRNHCGIGKNFLMMDASGDFYLCPWMVGKPAAKVHSLQDQTHHHLKQDLVELHNCQNCWARTLCGGGCHFIHSNNAQNKEKSYCERVRGTTALAIHYFGEFQRQAQEMTSN